MALFSSSVSLGALWSRPFCVLAPVVPAYRFTGSSEVPQGRCLWKHKQSFTCRVLQIMCALVQNRLCYLKIAFSEFYRSTSEAAPTITRQERGGHGARTRSTTVRGWRAPERREARVGACFWETCVGWKAGPPLSVVHHTGFSAFTSAPVFVIPIQALIA